MNKLESHAFTPTQIHSIYDNERAKAYNFSLRKFYSYSKTGKKANIHSQCTNVLRLNARFR